MPVAWLVSTTRSLINKLPNNPSRGQIGYRIIHYALKAYATSTKSHHFRVVLHITVGKNATKQLRTPQTRGPEHSQIRLGALKWHPKQAFFEGAFDPIEVCMLLMIEVIFAIYMLFVFLMRLVALC